MENNKLNLPKVWGQGAIFAHSGLDGVDTLENSLVGLLMADRIGMEFKTPIPSYVYFKLKDVQDVIYDLISNDLIKSQIMDMEGNLYDFNIMYSSENTLVCKTTHRTKFFAEFDEDMEEATDGALKTYKNGNEFYAIYQKEENGIVKIAFSYGKNADKDAKAAVELDFDKIVEERLAFYDKLPRPASFKDEDEEMVYYKCFSVMKSMIHTPEGKFKRKWSTPDRFPHKYLWLWDSAFHSVGMKYISKELAEELLIAVFDGQDTDGFIPHMSAPYDRSEISQSPVLAWAVLELYKEYKDPSLAEKLFEKLEGYLLWDLKNRDINGNGLLEWVVNLESIDCRCDESGMDNTPRFDNEAEADCIDFSAHIANEMRCMVELAKILGKEDAAKFWQEKFNATRDAINSYLWDDEDKFYYDRRLSDGTFIKVKSVASFLPLFAGVCDEEKAKYLVEHLENPNEFKTAFMIATVSADHETYKTMDMFRGTVWLNFNYLIAQGLDEYGYTELADEIREKTIEMIKKWYLSDGVIYEFYDSRDKVAPRRLSRKGIAIQPYLSSVKFQAVRDFSWGSCFLPDMIMKRK